MQSLLATLERVGGAGGPLARFFAREREMVLARAPGRLDVMGGIADYSGSLVLELPLAVSALVAVQRATDGIVAVASAAPDGAGPVRVLDVPASELLGGTTRARAWFAAAPERHFAAYVAGTLAVLAEERLVSTVGSGLRLLVSSTVPEGSGVSSSAAVTVAAMVALCALCELRLAPVELALLCQAVEDRVVGAPSGVMDPMTATLGEEGRLLELLCQPAFVRGQLSLPENVELWGIDSRVRHHVMGTEYATVRTGAFMGKRLLLERLGAAVPAYLASIGPQLLQRHLDALPEWLRGSEFLARFGETEDPATRVDPQRDYPVRAATLHPVLEHERVTRFADLLRSRGPVDLEGLGELMAASHASYGACGLGSKATDRLVELVRQAGSQAGLHGAKITGRGSGGTIAVLADRGSDAAMQAVVEAYAKESGSVPVVMKGSSPGAAVFGALGVSAEGGAVRVVEVLA